MKVLLISTCSQCPFFKAEPLQHIEDSFKAICTAGETEQDWQVKIGRQISIPPFCPLKDEDDES